MIIIKFWGKACLFVGGVGLGMLGQKYSKDLMNMAKNMGKSMNKCSDSNK